MSPAALDFSLASLDSRFKEIAEDPEGIHVGDHKADEFLVELGFIDAHGALTDAGSRLYVSQVVKQDDKAGAEALGEILKGSAVVTAFCGTLWGSGDAPIAGAVSLLKRLTGAESDTEARRWLRAMNRGKLIAYNQNQSTLRVLFNPEELVPPDEATDREREAGHVISPETPYGNLLSLRDLLRASRGYIRWYEQHMEPKVLEVLYRELSKGNISEVRLLSGPAKIDDDAQAEFKKFRKELKDERGVDCEWRVLSKKDAQQHHDRFFFSEGIARNLPPLNLILQGSKGEILPSGIEVSEFDRWWEGATDIFDVAVEN